MSGQSIPYRLRQNKAVDRIAFSDLLIQISKVVNISDYHYIGFGSHSLEDFKYIHTQFGINKMTSLEYDEETFKRQKFNKPISCIKCLLTRATDYITLYNRKHPTIAWLDYVSVKDMQTQLGDLSNLISKLEPYDIIKITMNANPSNLARQEGDLKGLKLHKHRLKVLEDLLGDFFSSDINALMMTNNGYPKALKEAIKLAVSIGLNGRPDLIFQPLSIFTYKDGQEMMSLTGIILEKSEVKKFLHSSKIKRWPLASLDWINIIKINIPDFTPKEKIFVDSLLPSYKATTIQKRLKFSYENEDNTRELLEAYALFYRHSSYFSRVAL